MAKKATTSKKPAARKPATKKKVTFDHAKTYEVEAVASKHLEKGKIYKVTGEIAEALVNSGQAKVK